MPAWSCACLTTMPKYGNTEVIITPGDFTSASFSDNLCEPLRETKNAKHRLTTFRNVLNK